MAETSIKSHDGEHDQDYEDALRTYLSKPVERPEGPTYRFSLIACARWEEDHIAEWLNYHRSIGFEHVYLYGNDDDPATLYAQLLPFLAGPQPFVTFVHYQYQGQQLAIYRDAIQRFSTQTEWLMLLDVDEFLCLPGVDDVATFMQRFDRSVDAVYFNWQSFGTGGHAVRPKGSVLLNYTGAEGIVSPFTKNLIRSSSIPYAALHHHRHIAMMHDWMEAGPHLEICNVIGDPMADYYLEWPYRAWTYLLTGDINPRIRQTAYIAHFSMKSDEDFDRRVARGLAGDYSTESMWGAMTSDDRMAHNARTNAVNETYLRDYWLQYLRRGYEHALFPARRWTLVSEGCAATQSSVIDVHARHRSPEEDAALLLNAAPLGAPRNHTEREVDPWWKVDLGRVVELREIRLFNRLDAALERMAILRIETSPDDDAWSTILDKQDDRLFGGLDGTPLVIGFDSPLSGRYVRITVPGDNYLHFDRVEVFATE